MKFLWKPDNLYSVIPSFCLQNGHSSKDFVTLSDIVCFSDERRGAGLYPLIEVPLPSKLFKADTGSFSC